MKVFDSFSAEQFLRDVLGARNIKRSGDQLIHSCLLPFDLHPHGDRNPSASLNSELLLYNCFTCGGGTLIWATEHILGISSPEARRLIEQNLSPVNITKEQFMEKISNYWKGSPEQSIPEYSFKILEPWMCYTKYMDERKVSKQTQKDMKTGLNLNNVDKIGEHFVKQPRIIVPHIIDQKLRGWTMRKIDSRQAGSKWMHTPNFPKETTLYNWDNVVREGHKEVIMVESPMSVLRMKTEEIHNVVATFGAEINDDQIKRLMTGGFDSVILFPDGDLAGYRSLKRQNKKGQEIGTLYKIRNRVNTYVIDHGIIEKDGNLEFSGKDAADYSRSELDDFLSKKIPSFKWQWKDEDGLQKMDKNKTKSTRVFWNVY